MNFGDDRYIPINNIVFDTVTDPDYVSLIILQ